MEACSAIQRDFNAPVENDRGAATVVRTAAQGGFKKAVRSMPLRVSGKNLDIGESLRTHVTEKVETLISRYFDGRSQDMSSSQPEGSAYRTDCSLHLSSGMNLQAEGRAHEPYASFEQAADKIERRLRRYKKRLKDHQAGGDTASTSAREKLHLAKFVIEAPDEIEEAPSRL